MGFAMKTPKIPAVETEPPVVAETLSTDAETDAEQQSARRRGLLSTLLSDRRKPGALAPTPPQHNSTTLG